MQLECEDLKRQLAALKADMEKLRNDMQAQLDAANAANASANANAASQLKSLEDELAKLRQELTSSKVHGSTQLEIRTAMLHKQHLFLLLRLSVLALGVGCSKKRDHN